MIENENFQTFIAKSRLSARALNVLKAKVPNFEALTQLDYTKLKRLPNCGHKTALEILAFIDKHNIQTDLSDTKANTINDDEPSCDAEEVRIKQLSASPPTPESLAILPIFSSKPLPHVTIADLHIDFKAHTKLSEIPLPIRIKNVLTKMKLKHMGKLLLYPLSSLMKQENFGRKSLNDLHHLIRNLLIKSKDRNSSDAIDYSSYANMIKSFITACIKHQKRQLIILKGLLPPDRKKITLAEIGQELHLTRERVRQIFTADIQQLKIPSNLDKLSDFWNSAEEIICSGGGIINLENLGELLKAKYDWAETINPHSLKRIVQLNHRYLFDKETYLITAKACECLDCDIPPLSLKTIFEKHGYEVGTDILCQRLREYCQEKCKRGIKAVDVFHNAYILTLLKKYSETLNEIKAVPVADAVRNLLKSNPLPAKYQDIIACLGNSYHIDSIHSCLKQLHHIGEDYYDIPDRWNSQTTSDFIKLLPEPAASFAQYLG